MVKPGQKIASLPPEMLNLTTPCCPLTKSKHFICCIRPSSSCFLQAPSCWIRIFPVGSHSSGYIHHSDRAYRLRAWTQKADCLEDNPFSSICLIYLLNFQINCKMRVKQIYFRAMVSFNWNTSKALKILVNAQWKLFFCYICHSKTQ